MSEETWKVNRNHGGKEKQVPNAVNEDMKNMEGVFNWEGERESKIQGVGMRRNKRILKMFEKVRMNNINSCLSKITNNICISKYYKYNII